MRWSGVFAALGALAACGDLATSGPFDGLRIAPAIVTALAIDFDVWRLAGDQLARIVYAMLTDSRSFVTSPATQQPILCDNYGAAGPDDSCTKVILQAMVDAMTHLESPQGFGTQDTRAWRWGRLHRLRIASLLPDPALNLPAMTDADPAGFPYSIEAIVRTGELRWVFH